MSDRAISEAATAAAHVDFKHAAGACGDDLLVWCEGAWRDVGTDEDDRPMCCRCFADLSGRIKASAVPR